MTLYAYTMASDGNLLPIGMGSEDNGLPLDECDPLDNSSGEINLRVGRPVVRKGVILEVREEAPNHLTRNELLPDAMVRFESELEELERRLDGVKEEDDDFVDDEIAEEGEFELVDEEDVVIDDDDYQLLQDKLELIH